MLYQNFKGFLTLALVLSLVATGFYFYKGVVETGFIQNQNLEQFAVTTDSIEVKPKIEISGSGVDINWETPYETSGTVKYCKSKTEGSSCKTTSTSFGKTHSIQILQLTPNQNYFYQIGIDGTYYPNGDYYTFKLEGSSIKKARTVENIKTPGSSGMSQKFLNALKTQNLDYDYNKDGVVTAADIRSVK